MNYSINNNTTFLIKSTDTTNYKCDSKSIYITDFKQCVKPVCGYCLNYDNQGKCTMPITGIYDKTNNTCRATIYKDTYNKVDNIIYQPNFIPSSSTIKQLSIKCNNNNSLDKYNTIINKMNYKHHQMMDNSYSLTNNNLQNVDSKFYKIYDNKYEETVDKKNSCTKVNNNGSCTKPPPKVNNNGSCTKPPPKVNNNGSCTKPPPKVNNNGSCTKPPPKKYEKFTDIKQNNLDIKSIPIDITKFPDLNTIIEKGLPLVYTNQEFIQTITNEFGININNINIDKYKNLSSFIKTLDKKSSANIISLSNNIINSVNKKINDDLMINSKLKVTIKPAELAIARKFVKDATTEYFNTILLKIDTYIQNQKLNDKTLKYITNVSNEVIKSINDNISNTDTCTKIKDQCINIDLPNSNKIKNQCINIDLPNSNKIKNQCNNDLIKYKQAALKPERSWYNFFF
jgi:hypothetical protein